MTNTMMLGKLLTPYCLASATSDILTAGMETRSRSSSIDSRAARHAREVLSAASSEKIKEVRSEIKIIESLSMDKSKKGSSYIRNNSKGGIDIGFLEFSDSLIV